MNHYERCLPHWYVIGQPLFVTFCLGESLPANRIFPPARITSGKAFVTMDQLLDCGREGALFLRQPQIASKVVDALTFGRDRGSYELHAFVVMPNHVQMLATPRVEPVEWLGRLKGYTAYEANRIMNRRGAFWQRESYDHLVRNRDEFERIRIYIEKNPVRAGLVSVPEEFPWSSGSRADARLRAESTAPQEG